MEMLRRFWWWFWAGRNDIRYLEQLLEQQLEKAYPTSMKIESN